MVEIATTEEYDDWVAGLRDERASLKIAARLGRVQRGLLGDVKPVGEGVSEFRIDYGPGYRVYFMQQGQLLIILLAGGTKQTQQRDIRQAHALAQRIKDAGYETR